jgi:hypothetical protein
VLRSEVLQPRALVQFEWSVAYAKAVMDMDREKSLISRQTKGTWRVALGSPKDSSTTETAHHSRLI